MSELNLIPYELKQKKAKEFKFKYYLIYGIAALALVVVIIMLPKLYIVYLNAEENAVSTKISNNSKVVLENQKILADISSYKLYSDKADAITKQKVNIANRIGDLGKYAPADVTFSNMALAKGAITISGNTKNYKSVSVFVANLQMTKEYSTAKIVNISDLNSKDKNAAGKYQFSISIPN